MTKYRLALLLIAIILALASYFGLGRDQTQHLVLAAADGDTILVDMFGQTETVRLIGVDTPETHHPNKPVQCFGPEASAFTTDSLVGEYVSLVADPLSDNRDRYDRLLRYVYLDGDLHNLELIKRGYGFAITAFDHSQLINFTFNESQAKNAQIGLWGSCQIDYDGGYPSTTSQSTS